MRHACHDPLLYSHSAPPPELCTRERSVPFVNEYSLVTSLLCFDQFCIFVLTQIHCRKKITLAKVESRTKVWAIRLIFSGVLDAMSVCQNIVRGSLLACMNHSAVVWGQSSSTRCCGTMIFPCKDLFLLLV